MVRGLGEDQAIGFITQMIEGLNNSIAVGNKMNEENIMESAVIIVYEHGFLKIEQLAQFIHYAKTGKLGVFQRFDQTTMFEALNRYTSDTDNDIAEDYNGRKIVENDRPKRGNAQKIGSILTLEDLNQIKKGTDEGK